VRAAGVRDEALAQARRGPHGRFGSLLGLRGDHLGLGSGSFLPEHWVSNEEILRYLRPARPDGRLLEPEWVVRNLTIHERRLDYEFGGRRKRSRAEGGLYDGDLALGSAGAALDNAGMDARKIDLIVHVCQAVPGRPIADAGALLRNRAIDVSGSWR
jgi:hypothetical protein